jgi:hypothetical protein
VSSADDSTTRPTLAELEDRARHSARLTPEGVGRVIAYLRRNYAEDGTRRAPEARREGRGRSR